MFLTKPNNDENYQDLSGEYETMYESMKPTDATIDKVPFIVRDFIIGKYIIIKITELMLLTLLLWKIFLYFITECNFNDSII